MRLNNNGIREKIKGTFIETLNIQFVENDNESELEATMYVTANMLQTSGVLHGGATIALGETVAGIASNIMCREDECALGIQMSTSHMTGGKQGDTVRAKATPVHIGRTTHVWNVDIVSESTGKLVSSLRATNIIIKRK